MGILGLIYIADNSVGLEYPGLDIVVLCRYTLCNNGCLYAACTFSMLRANGLIFLCFRVQDTCWMHHSESICCILHAYMNTLSVSY